ncbi:MAG: hypothetical protein AAF570_05295, partial [Bacteroidota bacterium]
MRMFLIHLNRFFARFFPRASALAALCLCLAAAFTEVSAQSSQLFTHWESRSPMPARRANMATASLEIGDTTWIYTFMGIDSTKACGTGIRLESWKYNTVTDTWFRIADVPDTEGRLAASATGLNGKIYLIGGYKVFNDCNEFTSPRVDIYDPATDTWSLGDTIIVPTDDHVQVLYRDSLIICISGWSNNTNTRRVQIYDTYLDQWSLSNDITGPGLFGHCGGISGDTILYFDGVRIAGTFVLSNSVRRGVIQNGDPHTIQWTSLGLHPGAKVYRGGGFGFQDRVIVTGGTNNAYNIDGIGYNNVPSVESGRTFGYNLTDGLYEEYARNPDSAMDVREVVQVGTNRFYVVGGMEANQTVTNKVSVFVIDSVVVGLEAERLSDIKLRVWPNPVQAQFNVEFVTDALTTVNFELWDMRGKRIFAV